MWSTSTTELPQLGLFEVGSDIFEMGLEAL